MTQKTRLAHTVIEPTVWRLASKQLSAKIVLAFYICVNTSSISRKDRGLREKCDLHLNLRGGNAAADLTVSNVRGRPSFCLPVKQYGLCLVGGSFVFSPFSKDLRL